MTTAGADTIACTEAEHAQTVRIHNSRQEEFWHALDS